MALKEIVETVEPEEIDTHTLERVLMDLDLSARARDEATKDR